MANDSVDINEYRNKKAHEGMSKRVHQQLEKVRQHDASSKERFLAAWKRGIKTVGTEFFDVKCNIDEATDKWQLAPNYEFIGKTMGGYSHGHQVLLSLMYSFYNSEDGQKLLEKTGTPNLVDALAVLDFDGREIISELWLNYSGW